MSSEQANPTLLQRIAAGDGSAVREVVDTYGGLIWSLAGRFCPTAADAEDAVQDVFVLLWRKAGKFDPALGTELTFVSVLTRRLLIDRWRRQASRPALSGMDADRAVLDEGLLERFEQVRAAAAALEELDEPHRTALRLALDQGCSHTEIAEITQSPLGTVKSRIRNGLRRIRESMEAVESGARTGARTAAGASAGLEEGR